MTARTAYGLDTRRGTHWADLAACSPANGPVDPDWWWPMPGQIGPETIRAAHVCRTHCPVRDACHADAVNNPPRHPCVQGGVRYVAVSGGGGRVRASRELMPTPTDGCPYCPKPQHRPGRALQPHGTHAAAQRHRYHGEPLCDPCRDAERARDRDRKRTAYWAAKGRPATTTEGTRAA